MVKRSFEVGVFLRFVCLSGLGWLCDLSSFTLLVSFFDVPVFVANFVSSYVGVTFVWFASLKIVFGRSGAARGHLLFIYWGFQLLSILAYSQLLSMVAGVLDGVGIPLALSANPAIAAKIIVTPFNLVSNFIFMKFLTRYMRDAQTAHA